MGCVQSTPKSIEAAYNFPHAPKPEDVHIVVKNPVYQTPPVRCVKAVDDVGSSAATPSSNASVECPNLRMEEHAGVKVQVNRCPFGHGSVGAGPFPGYVHGTNSTVCKEGCKPDPALGKYGRVDETSRQTLVREALEYQEVYHKDKGSPAAVKEARIKEVLAEIEATGTYRHTYDELQHGGRVAWRCVLLSSATYQPYQPSC